MTPGAGCPPPQDSTWDKLDEACSSIFFCRTGSTGNLHRGTQSSVKSGGELPQSANRIPSWDNAEAMAVGIEAATEYHHECRSGSYGAAAFAPFEGASYEGPPLTNRPPPAVGTSRADSLADLFLFPGRSTTIKLLLGSGMVAKTELEHPGSREAKKPSQRSKSFDRVLRLASTAALAQRWM